MDFLKTVPCFDFLYGDVPFLNENDLMPALELHREKGHAVTVITAVVD